MVTTQPDQSPPHRLELVIDFVNTLDIDEGSDALATPAQLRGWLTERELLGAREAAPDEHDLKHAIELREALRSLMLANNGARESGRAGRELDRAARRGELAVRFDELGRATAAPSSPGAAGALARLLVPLADAGADGSWSRVKACRAPDCLWAFYDQSRNRSGVWCDMAVCGNRTKVRAYRQRAPRRGG